jgi:hypothetical protein
MSSVVAPAVPRGALHFLHNKFRILEQFWKRFGFYLINPRAQNWLVLAREMWWKHTLIFPRSSTAVLQIFFAHLAQTRTVLHNSGLQ